MTLIRKNASPEFETFAKLAADYFLSREFQVEWPSPVNKHFDFTATKRDVRYAIQAKGHGKQLGLGDVKKFAAFMTSADASAFARGLLVSSSGVTKGGKEFIDKNPHCRIKFYKLAGSEIHQTAGFNESEQRHIGVFTFKGGVGKTKVSLLMASALAYRGEDALLVDLNRAQNLHNLVGDVGFYISGEKRSGSTVVVYTKEQWKKEPVSNVYFVIYDCPQFFEKAADKKLVASFDYILSPVMLTADSLGVDYSVIRQTVDEIRAVNTKAPILFFANNTTQEQATGTMRRLFLDAKSVIHPGEGVSFIDPGQFSIPHSRELEEIGTERILDRARKIEILISRTKERDSPWRKLLELADYTLDTTHRFN